MRIASMMIHWMKKIFLSPVRAVVYPNLVKVTLLLMMQVIPLDMERLPYREFRVLPIHNTLVMEKIRLFPKQRIMIMEFVEFVLTIKVVTMV